MVLNVFVFESLMSFECFLKPFDDYFVTFFGAMDSLVLGDYVLKVIEGLLNNRARNIFLEAIVTYKILVSLISKHS